MKFSRQEYWRGLPFPSPGNLLHPGTEASFLESSALAGRFFTSASPTAAAAAKSLQSCPTLCDPRDSSPTRLPRPWDSPGKNTGVGCHCLLQCMKVKRESEVAQSCPTLSDPMDCSPPDSSIHGIFQARVLEWGAIAFSERILTARSDQIRSVAQSCLTLSNPMDCSPPGSSIHGIFQTRVLEWVAIAFSEINSR